MFATSLAWLSAHAQEGKKMVTADEIIKKLDLTHLEGEGGYFRQTYKSTSPELPASEFGLQSSTPRSLATAIYYLVTPDGFSALHRLTSDEIFHFYAGDPVEMVQIDDFGNLKQVTLGSNIMAGQLPQVVVPKGTWQGTQLKAGGKWGLMGTTVSPGFEFEDFELGERDQLIRAFPQLREHIIRYTRGRDNKAPE